jgi:hypothetical protein
MPWHSSNRHYGLEDLEEPSFLCIVLGEALCIKAADMALGTLVIVRVDDS